MRALLALGNRRWRQPRTPNHLRSLPQGCDVLSFDHLFFHKQCQGGGKSVQKTALSNRPDFAIAEKPRQADGAEAFLDELRVVVWPTEHTLAPPIAAAETTAVNGSGLQSNSGLSQQFIHVLGRGVR